MKRTISAMVGKGSVNHNSRKFKAENVDGDRTHLNVDYCNEPIRKVYHKLFDDALNRYNDRQTRADRRIDDYYEKIRTGKQEKPFHELILQIGNREDTGAETEIGAQAKAALDEYFRGFQARNPNLYVFSAHLHKRGLDTRVSLKQALAAQGFRGGTRGATEWAQWVQSEKEQLALVMERHGFEWERKGTHEQHLSVIDYKKQERTKELAVVEQALTEKQEEYSSVVARIYNLEDADHAYSEMARKLDTDPEFQIPEPQGLMSAKTYKTRFVEPLVNRLKAVIKGLLVKYFRAVDEKYAVRQYVGSLRRENEDLTYWNDRIKNDNKLLRKQNEDYKLLRKVFGSKQIDALVAQAREAQRTGRQPRNRDRDYER